MKTFFITLLLCAGAFILPLSAQEDAAPWIVKAAWGSWQGRYWAAVTDLSLSAPLHQEPGLGALGLEVRLRSHGTWYFFSTSSYDLEARVVLSLPGLPEGVHLDLSAGAEAQLRFSKDERSYAETTWAPLLGVTPGVSWEGVQFKAPLAFQFYADGLLTRTILEVGYLGVEGWLVYLQGEMDWLYSYSDSLGELRFRSLAGVGWEF